MDHLPRQTKTALRLTRVGMVAERLVQAFFPLWSIGFAALGALLLGWHETLPLEAVWSLLVTVVLGGLWALWHGVRRFHWPTATEAVMRLDSTLKGQPLATLSDDLVIGANDPASQAVWAAHRRQMEARAARAKPAQPDLKVSRLDPFALRYLALLVLVVGVLFGSLLRVASVGDIAQGGGPLAAGPTWEGWAEPPAYTRLPAIYLPDITDKTLELPEGSRITIRLYGEVGALTVAETVSARTGELPSAADPVQTFAVTQAGRVEIDGAGGRSWDITLDLDLPPYVGFALNISDDGDVLTNDLQQPFDAADDYGVVSGQAVLSLDLAAVDRRYGLKADPDPRDDVVLQLPMTISGDRSDFREILIENFDAHPWAHLPVTLTLMVTDEAGQSNTSETIALPLPARRFFDPLGKALIEQRQSLLWARANAPDVAMILRAVSHYPEDIFRGDAAYLTLRVAIRRLEDADEITPALQAEVAQALWDLAIQLEEGDLEDAAERLARAQERLQEAIENGASDEEIAQLMQELREAMDDYMRQLAETRPEQPQGDSEQQAQNGEVITQDQLQEMLDEIQRLMEEGRMAEAEALLQQLNEMMENMQVAEGQQGEGGEGQGEGQQAMNELSDTLREQQGLSDEAFRDLQEQFNPDAQAGENQGNVGRSGGQGAGAEHSPGQSQPNGEGRQQGAQGQEPGGSQQGEGGQQSQGGQDPGEGQQGGQQGGSQEGESGRGEGEGSQQGGADPDGGLADRQQALRDELNRQRGTLPGAGTEAGEAARDALDRADRAMDNAAQALRENDLAQALDDQSEAIDALREGMQSLGEAMAENQQEGQQGQEGQGQQGQQQGAAQPGQLDPFGRDPAGQGAVGTGENLMQGDDVYRRAEELLEELRRRSSEQERPKVELDYLRRLLDRF